MFIYLKNREKYLQIYVAIVSYYFVLKIREKD